MYENLYKEIYHKIQKQSSKNTPEIVKIWEKSLSDVSKKDLDSAYERILSSGKFLNDKKGMMYIYYV